MLRLAVALLSLMIAGGAAAAPAAPRTFSEVVASAAPQEVVHLVFVHGIRTDERGASFALQRAMCEHDRLGAACGASVRIASDVLDIRRPQKQSIAGQRIWRSGAEWDASRPLVDHYVYTLSDGRTLVVDEVNWWRFTYPIKCRFLVQPEAQLIGYAAPTAQKCANMFDTRGALPDHFAWIDAAGLQAMRQARPKFGGDPLANRWVKAEFIDWGLSEAVLALGDTKEQLREAIRCAMTAVASFDPRQGTEVARKDLHAPPPGSGRTVACEGDQPPPATASRFVLVSHSLGSFLLLDTFAAAAGQLEEGAARPSQALCSETSDAARLAAPASGEGDWKRARGLCFVVKNSAVIYFLANQIPLLEIGRLEAGEMGSTRDTLGAWSRLVCAQAGRRLQITAFSDPGDDLTFPVPPIDSATVDNPQVRNAHHWFDLVENPETAHGGYFTNPAVLKAMFARTAAGAAPPAACPSAAP